MSTIKVNSIKSTSTNDGGISIDASGHVTVDGLALPTAGPLSNRNLVVNGGMAVAQRGTSSTGQNYQTVDRFKVSYGGGTVTQSQLALTSGDPYDEGFRFAFRATNTSTATGAGNNRRFSYAYEAQDVATSGWNYTSSTSYITLSFWVRSSVAQEFFAYVKTSDGTAQMYTFSIGTLVADTWTKITKTIPGNSNLTIDNDNGRGFEFYLAPFWGTDFTDSGVTVDTWRANNDAQRTPDYTDTWAGTTNATFDFTGFQTEVGQIATPFEHRSYGDELRRCQRYYYRLARGASTVFFGPGFATGSTGAFSYFVLPTEMRDEPSVDTTGTASDYKVRRSVANVTCSAVPTISVRSKEGVALTLSTSSGLTAGEGIFLRMDAAGVFIAFASEL